MTPKKKYVVIGGAGNLGEHIVSMLVEMGQVPNNNSNNNSSIVCVDLCQYTGQHRSLVSSIVLDIAQPDTAKQLVVQVFSGNEEELVVFHAAAIIDIRPVPSPRLWQVNVQGTKHVISACQEMVQNQSKTKVVLIYTSSLECVSGYLENGELQALDGGVDEDVPYPAAYFLPYAQTKAQAECLVLEANNNDGNLKTISLRPGFIVGPDCIGVKLEILRAVERNPRHPLYVTARVPAAISCGKCFFSNLQAPVM